jgi:hypothetical protein
MKRNDGQRLIRGLARDRWRRRRRWRTRLGSDCAKSAGADHPRDRALARARPRLSHQSNRGASDEKQQGCFRWLSYQSETARPAPTLPRPPLSAGPYSIDRQETASDAYSVRGIARKRNTRRLDRQATARGAYRRDDTRSARRRSRRARRSR